VAVPDRNPIFFRNAIIEINAIKNFTLYLPLCDSYDHAAKISSKMDPLAKKKKNNSEGRSLGEDSTVSIISFPTQRGPTVDPYSSDQTLRA